MSEYSTIFVHKETKKRLEAFKEYVKESYDEVINRLVSIVSMLKDEGELTQEALSRIEKARKQAKEGKAMSTKELMLKLGI